ncbi:uncharacterized protein F5Z01DRAFT_674262 [Emericellopsis atlantica]|uniref:Uncharacterized protein n=1 Tax=Emericellopsis atlantica TaxID=2614577 RepID=A0A9P7ZMX9_9HYPO|nr:uncharacterized protein F5Z01DRAFT_674262 [Emericellopsis atlantica]KAG9254525.1 hypothetical protein F5Z01DRAFT_674262 [Emericellopsis atlantica]
MDFVFFEDPALEDASIGDLKRPFRAWFREENMPRGTRHESFIVVDDAALHASHFSLVRSFPEDSEEEGREHDKIRGRDIGTELYEALGDTSAPWM